MTVPPETRDALAEFLGRYDQFLHTLFCQPHSNLRNEHARAVASDILAIHQAAATGVNGVLTAYLLSLAEAATEPELTKAFAGANPKVLALVSDKYPARIEATAAPQSDCFAMSETSTAIA